MSSKSVIKKYNRSVHYPDEEGEWPSNTTAVPDVVKRYDNIVKSQEDKRLYRGLELKNKLKVLLVSDPTAEKAYAALDIGVGYMSDPDELPGLANLCQHMLTLGSETYPEMYYFKEFLSKHGGTAIASTAPDHTTYCFDVLPAHLYEALHAFVQYFISPEFPLEAVAGKLRDIEAEYLENLSDTSKMHQQMKNILFLKHACGKFGTGKRETLETIIKAKNMNVHQELMKFHNKWYSSNIMTLVVLCKDSLDLLEAMVAPLFSDIDDTSVMLPTWPEHPFSSDQHPKKIYWIPVEDVRTLSVIFPIPDVTKYYKSRPEQYILYLLSHRGPGSLYGVLNARGWCNSINTISDGVRGFGSLGVQMDLTEEGVSHIDDVIYLLFQNIAMLRSLGPQRWVWEELRDMKAVQFRFKNEEDPRDMVWNHVRCVQDFPMEHVLSAYYLLTEYKPQLITDLLSLLTPQNVLVVIAARSIGGKCTTTEYGSSIKYIQEDISECLLKEWKSVVLSEELHLPPPNEFIPSNFELVKCEECPSYVIRPALIKETTLMRLWYKQDTEFLLPKAWITFDILSPLLYADPLTCNLASMWVSLLKDNLQHLSFASEWAGIMWKIDYIENGITVTMEGFNDKQPLLVDKIMDHIVTFKAQPKRFQVLKDHYISTMETDLPKYEMALYLGDLAYSRYQLLATTKDITLELLNEFVCRAIADVQIEGFIFGNFTKETAIQIADSVEKKFHNHELSSPVI